MSRLYIIPLLLLSACNGLELGDNDPTDYNTSNKVVNKVGPNGELISPPNCPNWTASPFTTYDNAKQGNFGCATVTNLGLMLEDPRDLERGASGGKITPDATRSSEAIQNYRKGLSNPASEKSTGSPVADAVAGSISGGGQ
ncbi:MAG: CpaD family pilus assembly lipoprotein [Alphaproteobacteria bacterium]|nr:CpaD family pilus assembly lipoprotein [Alphaproteobacteria bacterium]